jgi:hypothetical protein
MLIEVGDIVEVMEDSPFYGATFLVSSVKLPDWYYLIPISVPEKLQPLGVPLDVGIIDNWAIAWVEGCMRRVS